MSVMQKVVGINRLVHAAVYTKVRLLIAFDVGKRNFSSVTNRSFKNACQDVFPIPDPELWAAYIERDKFHNSKVSDDTEIKRTVACSFDFSRGLVVDKNNSYS